MVFLLYVIVAPLAFLLSGFSYMLGMIPSPLMPIFFLVFCIILTIFFTIIVIVFYYREKRRLKKSKEKAKDIIEGMIKLGNNMDLTEISSISAYPLNLVKQLFYEFMGRNAIAGRFEGNVFVFEAPNKDKRKEVKESPGLVYCPSCGAELLDKSGGFCSKCGATIK